MKNAMLGFAAVCILFPLSAGALHVQPCRLRLTGRFVSPDYSRDMEVAVRLTVRAISESLWLEGRMRCTTPSEFSCFLSDSRFDVRLEVHEDGNRVGLRMQPLLWPRRNPADGVCELRAVTGQFRRNHCFGAIIGTFECPPEDVPVRGNFGWTVDTCRCVGR